MATRARETYDQPFMISSMEMILLCDELVGMLRKATEGITVNDSTLALEAIRRAGAGRHFLQDQHTLEHCRNIWMPGVFNRLPLAHWESSEQKDLFSTLNDRVSRILEKHETAPLEPAMRREIDRILRERENISSS